MTYTPRKNSWERVKDQLVPYWLAPHGILQEVTREKKPTGDYHPLTWADNPLDESRLRELWDEAGGKVLRFARLVEESHGIKEYEIESE